MLVVTEPRRRAPRRAAAAGRAGPRRRAPATATAPADIAPNDPLLAYLQAASRRGRPRARSSSTRRRVAELRAQGVRLVVPLVSQGELIGTLNLGPRLSEQDYSSDDRRLLDNLAAQAAPALRVGQLVREQEAEAADAPARRVRSSRSPGSSSRTSCPRELPDLPGWQIAAYYRPAREVGGDFYDVIPLPDGRDRAS